MDAPIPYVGTTDDFMVSVRPQGEPPMIDGKCLSCLGECEGGYHCCENCEHALRERAEWEAERGI